MKILQMLLITISLSAISLSAAQSQQTKQVTPSTVTPYISRYQLISAPIEDGITSEKTIFLLDTVTGKVWKFQTAFVSTDASGKKTSIPPFFIPIDVSNTPLASSPQK